MYEKTYTYQSDILNAENLPAVVSQFGYTCAQREVDSLLKVLASRGIGTVGELQDLATARRLDIIQNTYLSAIGRPPDTFEVVANLASLSGVDQNDEVAEMVRAQIAFTEEWYRMKARRL